MIHSPVRNLLSTRAMLAGVRISQWSARKLDRKVTDEVNTAHGASADAGRFNKALLDKASMAAVVKAASEARTFHYARTLPWLDDGVRILPAAAFADYSNAMRRIKADFESAVDEFVLDYARAVEAARIRLNGMFNAADYPPESEIRARFTFSTRILPVPDATDFRVDLADAQAADIRDAIEASAQEALEFAMADVRDRMLRTVGAMAEKLAAYRPGTDRERAEGIFRDSLVENVRDLAAILPGMNLTNDPRLSAIADRIKTDLCAHDADDLRESDRLRKETAKAAAAILADVQDFIA
ncbi:DUF3150 domain-containing protein [Alsobacter sp. SYSU BS001988]